MHYTDLVSRASKVKTKSVNRYKIGERREWWWLGGGGVITQKAVGQQTASVCLGFAVWRKTIRPCGDILQCIHRQYWVLLYVGISV